MTIFRSATVLNKSSRGTHDAKCAKDAHVKDSVAL